MTEIIRISLTTICYITEEIDLVVQSIRNCLPEEFREVPLHKQVMHSQFNDRLVLIKLEAKNNQIKPILEYFKSNLSENDKQYLHRHFAEHLDLEDKSFHFRLNKFKPLEEIITLGSGSDVIKIELKYSAFTKQQNSLESVKSLLMVWGLLIE